MPVRLVLDRGHPRALLRAGEDRGGSVSLQRPGVGVVDRLEVVPVNLLHVPAAGARPRRQRGGVPLVHGRATLAETVDVDDRDQVAEARVSSVLERLPHRPLGHLGVAAEHPYPEVGGFETGGGERDADRDGEALAERAGGDVDPGDLRRRVALQAGAELAEGEQLLVVDRPRRLVERVEQRRGVALGEDEVVVRAVLGGGEVVAEVAREEHRHQVGGRHRGRRMAGAGRGGRADRVDAKLLGELAHLLLADRGLRGGDLVQGQDLSRCRREPDSISLPR